MNFNALLQAIKCCLLGKEPVKGTAKAYGFPRSSLQRYIKKVTGQFDEISSVEDGVLLEFIRTCSERIPSNMLRILVNHMENDWNYWTSKVERTILQKGAIQGNRLTILFAVNMYATVLTFILMSMTPIVFDYFIPLNETRPRRLVYAAKYPVDEEKYLSWVLIHGSITSLCNMTVIFSCESMFAVTTQHVCSLFAIVSHHLQKINKYTQGNKNCKSIEDSCYNQLTSCIKWHNHALKYKGEWYNLPLCGKKLITPIILRGQIPSTLTVGKFCDMDMIVFATLVRTSVSYFTVLSSVR